MSIFRMYTVAATLALVGVLPVSPVVMAFDGQDYANIQSQCRREAQEYGIAPEQMEEYVSGCIMAYGGMPEAEPEAPPVDAGAEVPADDGQGASYSDEQDPGGVVE